VLIFSTQPSCKVRATAIIGAMLLKPAVKSGPENPKPNSKLKP
jgi:hypothetical protein